MFLRHNSYSKQLIAPGSMPAGISYFISIIHLLSRGIRSFLSEHKFIFISTDSLSEFFNFEALIDTDFPILFNNKMCLCKLIINIQEC